MLQEVLTPTPSCVAALDALINVQTISTQAHRSAFTHFAICPLLVLLLSIPSITYLRALAELSSRCFQVPTLLPFPTKVRKLLLRRGSIHPTFFLNSRPKFDMEASQTFQQDNIIITRRCAVCRSTQIRQRTCVNQLGFRDNWNPSQSESSCPLLKPWMQTYSRPFGGGVLVVIVTARTNPSLRALYDVQACFVGRHNKILAPSRGQAW